MCTTEWCVIYIYILMQRESQTCDVGYKYTLYFLALFCFCL